MKTARNEDDNGYIEIKNNPISKIGVFEYSGVQIDPDGTRGLEPTRIYKVYRPPEELADLDCIESFKLVPWIDDHAMLGSYEEGLTPPEYKGIDGVTGEDVRFENGYLLSNIKIFSEKLKKLVANDKKELSIGYRCIYDSQSGIYNGEKYDFIQRKIRGNHLALVDEGRAGHEVAVLDHFTFTFDSKGLDGMNEGTEKTGKDAAVSIETVMEKLAEVVARLEKLEKMEISQDDENSEMEKEEKTEDAETEEKTGETKMTGDNEKYAAMDAKLKLQEKEIDAQRKELESFKKNGIKALFSEISKRDDLAERLSQHIGTFDHKEKTLEEIAKYGVDKLGIKCPAGHEITLLDGFLAGKKSAMQTVGTVAQDSAEITQSATIDAYLKGE
jgi:hypothetical protein